MIKTIDLDEFIKGAFLSDRVITIIDEIQTSQNSVKNTSYSLSFLQKIAEELNFLIYKYDITNLSHYYLKACQIAGVIINNLRNLTILSDAIYEYNFILVSLLKLYQIKKDVRYLDQVYYYQDLFNKNVAEERLSKERTDLNRANSIGLLIEIYKITNDDSVLFKINNIIASLTKYLSFYRNKIHISNSLINPNAIREILLEISLFLKNPAYLFLYEHLFIPGETDSLAKYKNDRKIEHYIELESAILKLKILKSSKITEKDIIRSCKTIQHNLPISHLKNEKVMISEYIIAELSLITYKVTCDDVFLDVAYDNIKKLITKSNLIPKNERFFPGTIKINRLFIRWLQLSRIIKEKCSINQEPFYNKKHAHFPMISINEEEIKLKILQNSFPWTLEILKHTSYKLLNRHLVSKKKSVDNFINDFVTFAGKQINESVGSHVALKSTLNLELCYNRLLNKFKIEYYPKMQPHSECEEEELLQKDVKIALNVKIIKITWHKKLTPYIINTAIHEITNEDDLIALHYDTSNRSIGKLILNQTRTLLISHASHKNRIIDIIHSILPSCDQSDYQELKEILLQEFKFLINRGILSII